MRGNEIDGIGKLWIIAPDVPDFTCRYRDIDGFLYLLDELDQVFDLLVGAINRLVADDDTDDIAVAPGKIDGGIDLALIAFGVLVDPGADGDLHAEFRGDRRHQFVALRRRIQTERPRQGREFLEVGANFLGVAGGIADDVTRFKRRVGSARQDAAELGCRLLLLE